MRRNIMHWLLLCCFSSRTLVSWWTLKQGIRTCVFSVQPRREAAAINYSLKSCGCLAFWEQLFFFVSSCKWPFRQHFLTLNYKLFFGCVCDGCWSFIREAHTYICTERGALWFCGCSSIYTPANSLSKQRPNSSVTSKSLMGNLSPN